MHKLATDDSILQLSQHKAEQVRSLALWTATLTAADIIEKLSARERGKDSKLSFLDKGKTVLFPLQFLWITATYHLPQHCLPSSVVA